MTLSPDGLWWWNGSQWVSAVSPDGRWRWDGAQWVLNAHRDLPVQRRALLVPSMDTRPLQLAVIAYLAISAVLSAYVMSTTESTLLHNLPSLQSDTLAGQAALDGIVNAVIAGGIVFTLLWNALLAVGAWLRWRWTYYVLMVLGFLALLGVLANVAGLALNSLGDTATASFVGVMSGLAYFGLAVWMFRLWRERGTAWAMQHRVEPAVAAPAH